MERVLVSTAVAGGEVGLTFWPRGGAPAAVFIASVALWLVKKSDLLAALDGAAAEERAPADLVGRSYLPRRGGVAPRACFLFFPPLTQDRQQQ